MVLQAVSLRPPKQRELRLTASDFDLESIDLYVTRHCNQKCDFCFHDDAYFSTGDEMSLKAAQAILTWAAEGGVRDVALLGGEPTLYRHLTEVLEVARSLGFATRLVTNGTTSFARQVEVFAREKLLSAVHVSVDGTKKWHDRTRGEGSFDLAVRSLTMAVISGLKATVNVTVHDGNLADVPSVVALARTAGAQRVNIHWMSPVGRARTSSYAPVGPNKWFALEDWVEGLDARAGFVVDCQAAYQRGEASTDRCAIRERQNLQFMPDGRVYACGLLIDRHDANGYFWDGHGLVKHGGAESELSVAASGCLGCPARPVATDGVLSACVYTRTQSPGLPRELAVGR
jgi:MoaA/NifB/PqqE/SkfB family radical SAM enzyme